METWFENRKARTGRVRDSKWGAGEIDGSIWDGEEVGRGAIRWGCGGGLRREDERGGIGVEAEEREREVVNGDERVWGRALDLEGGVATTW